MAKINNKKKASDDIRKRNQAVTGETIMASMRLRRVRRAQKLGHIHIVNQLIEKCREYTIPLCIAFVDYDKAFDSSSTDVASR